MSYFLTMVFVAFALLSPAVLPDGLVDLHLMEVLAALVLLTGLGNFSESEIGSTPDTYILIALIASCCVSTAATGWFGGVPFTLLQLLPQVLVFFFIVLNCRALPRLRLLVWVMLGACLYILCQGMLADAAGNVESPWIYMEGTLMRYRGLGFINDPNDLAQFCAMLIPMLFLRWKKGAFAANLLFTLLPSAAVAFLVYKTHSRGGTIALLAILLFTFKDKIGLVLSGILAAIASGGMIALNMTGGRGINEDDGGRVELWSEGLHVFETHPLFGVGVGNFSLYSSTGLTAHNSYVLSFAEIGLVGTVFWMGALTFAWSSLSDIASYKAAAPASDDTDEPLSAEDYALQDAPRPAPLLPQPSPAGMPAWMEAAARVPAVASHAYLSPGLQTATASPQVAFPQPFAPAADARLDPGFNPAFSDETEAPDDAAFAHYARVLRVSMVGFLVTAFFLSRTFIMVLYILLGMIAALRIAYRQRHPEYRLDVKALFKRTGYLMGGAIVFIYLFIRIKGR